MDYQAIVIGAGPGGYVCALRLAQLGKKVALVEQRDMGGTCLNAGCVPTKTLLREATYSQDLESIYKRKDLVIEQQRAGIAGLMKSAGVSVYQSRAKILADKQVLLSDESILTGEAIILATGAVPSVPPVAGADLAKVVTSDDVLLKFEEQPKRLAIIGGGVIGVEMASLYATLGSEVSIIEFTPRLLNNMDKEIGQSLGMLYKKQGIQVVCGAQVIAIESQDCGLQVHYSVKDKEEVLCADAVLFATGRRAATQELFDESLSPDMNKGHLVVNERFETSIEGVYAIGDVIGGIQLAHNASAQAKQLAAILTGQEEEVDLSLIPACVYTVPEIATVGLDATAAKEQGIDTIIGKYVMSGNAKTIIDQLPRGFVKLIFRADNHQLIGGVLYCGRASDLISAVTLAIRSKMTAEELAETVFAHPTYGEGIGEAAEVALGKSVHVLSR